MYSCKYCGTIFEHSFELAAHVKTLHTEKVVYGLTRCPICNKTISTRPDTYAEHLRFCKSKRHPYFCKTCGMLVSTENYFGSGKYCSRRCANTRCMSDTTKAKRKASMKQYVNSHPEVCTRLHDIAKRRSLSRRDAYFRT